MWCRTRHPSRLKVLSCCSLRAVRYCKLGLSLYHFFSFLFIKDRTEEERINKRPWSNKNRQTKASSQTNKEEAVATSYRRPAYWRGPRAINFRGGGAVALNPKYGTSPAAPKEATRGVRTVRGAGRREAGGGPPAARGGMKRYSGGKGAAMGQ
jgi:hypothetical protein